MKKIVKMIVLSALISLISNSCQKYWIKKSDKTYLQAQEYDGNLIRFDGYYYEIKTGEKPFVTRAFFYKNGYFITPGGFANSLEELDSYILNWIETKKTLPSIMSKGVYNIIDSTIQYERYYPSEAPYKSYIRAGKMLNDTTIHITESYRMKDGKKIDVDTEDETFYFRKFPSKPDSALTLQEIKLD